MVAAGMLHVIGFIYFLLEADLTSQRTIVVIDSSLRILSNDLYAAGSMKWVNNQPAEQYVQDWLKVCPSSLQPVTINSREKLRIVLETMIKENIPRTVLGIKRKNRRSRFIDFEWHNGAPVTLSACYSILHDFLTNTTGVYSINDSPALRVVQFPSLLCKAKIPYAFNVNERENYNLVFAWNTVAGIGHCVIMEINKQTPSLLGIWYLTECFCSKSDLTEIICEKKEENSTQNNDNIFKLRNKTDTFDINIRQEEIYTCESLEMILYIHKCDNKKDCFDGSDERNCGQRETTCALDRFECGNKLCIPIGLRCNHVKDCFDGSDEENCRYPFCSENQWRCDNEQCITVKNVCDNNADCFDGSDEKDGLCRNYKFKRAMCVIDSSSYRPKSRNCDGFPDCNYGDDELFDDTGYCLGSIKEGNIDDKFVFICASGQSYDSKEKCLLSINNYGDATACRDLSHLENCEQFDCPADFFKCPNSFCINIDLICDGHKHCIHGEDESECGSYVCPGYYRCHGQLTCIHLNRLCDDVRDCPEGDDEQCCYNCPYGCICKGLIIKCQFVPEILNISSLSRSFQHLDVSHIQLKNHSLNSLTEIDTLSHLILQNCSIGSLFINGYSLFNNSFENLLYLDLSANLFDRIDSYTFQSLRNLQTLVLNNNRFLIYLDSEGFIGLSKLKVLSLSHTGIQRIEKRTFLALGFIHTLNISRNPLTLLGPTPFENLKYLANLDFRQTSLIVEKDFFKGTNTLEKIYTNSFTFCCIKPKTVTQENCISLKEEISSCSNLIGIDVLKAFLWINGVIAAFGNAAVIIYKMFIAKRMRRNTFSLFVTNLGVADFLMGVYMLIIATVDTLFSGEYIWRKHSWTQSTICKLAGILATVSSESSVFFICLITLDRLVTLRNPLNNYTFSNTSAISSSIFAWFLSLCLAIVPTIMYPDFYSGSDICIALPITSTRTTGWTYSVALFIGVNGILFFLLCIGQKFIYKYVESSSKKIRSTRHIKDQRMATLLILVVITDFLCWIPIAVIGLIAISGNDISNDVYAWIMVFVLPVNSAINPFLYTFGFVIKNKFRERKNMNRQSIEIIDLDSTVTVMELINSNKMSSVHDKRGTTLSMLENKLNVKEGFMVCFRIAEAIDLLHSNHIIHGCLSPAFVKIIRKENYALARLVAPGKKLIRGYDAKDEIQAFGILTRNIIDNLTLSKH